MRTNNFLSLINAITKKDFQVNNDPESIEPGGEYIVYRITPLRGYAISVKFKAPKNEENLLRSFINTYCSKYLEPNPEAYDGKYPGSKSWDQMSLNDREFAHMHHRSNMKGKAILMDEIKANLEHESIENAFMSYGFYHTHYGIGIFVMFAGTYEMKAINKMKSFLKENNIPFTNEFSAAKWVYRFRVNLSKDLHLSLLKKFHSHYKISE